MDDAEFDAFADQYEVTLDRGLSVSGEQSTYFAETRVSWLASELQALGVRPRRILDFGCGTGSSTPFLLNRLQAEQLVGVDVSPRSIEVATRRHGSTRARFVTIDDYTPAGDLDLAFCNGVFHHIPPPDRPRAVEYIWRSLRPGGHWALWDNNPYNPGARWVMSRLPFDRDAIMLSAREAVRLLEAGSFEIVKVGHLFIFPARLRLLRAVEPMLARLPIGAQYQVIGRRPL